MKENAENPNEDTNKMKTAKSKQSTEFLVQLNALSKQRFIRTRGLSQVDDNPEMTKTLQLAKILRSMYNDVVSAKGLFRLQRLNCYHFDFVLSSH